MVSNATKVLNAIPPDEPRSRMLARRMLSMLSYLAEHYPFDASEDEAEQIRVFAPAIRLLPRFVTSQYLDIVKLSLEVAASILDLSMHNYLPCITSGLRLLVKRIDAAAESLVQDRCTFKSCIVAAKELLSRFRSASSKWAANKRKLQGGTKGKRRGKAKRKKSSLSSSSSSVSSSSQNPRENRIKSIAASIARGEDIGVDLLLQSIRSGFCAMPASFDLLSPDPVARPGDEAQLAMPFGLGDFLSFDLGSTLFSYIRIRGARALCRCFTKPNGQPRWQHRSQRPPPRHGTEMY
jgi:hypothetical protein